METRYILDPLCSACSWPVALGFQESGIVKAGEQVNSINNGANQNQAPLEDKQGKVCYFTFPCVTSQNAQFESKQRKHSTNPTWEALCKITNLQSSPVSRSGKPKEGREQCFSMNEAGHSAVKSTRWMNLSCILLLSGTVAGFGWNLNGSWGVNGTCSNVSFLIWWSCWAYKGMSINVLVADEASGWQIILTCSSWMMALCTVVVLLFIYLLFKNLRLLQSIWKKEINWPLCNVPMVGCPAFMFMECVQLGLG